MSLQFSWIKHKLWNALALYHHAFSKSKGSKMKCTVENIIINTASCKVAGFSKFWYYRLLNHETLHKAEKIIAFSKLRCRWGNRGFYDIFSHNPELLVLKNLTKRRFFPWLLKPWIFICTAVKMKLLHWCMNSSPFKILNFYDRLRLVITDWRSS